MALKYLSWLLNNQGRLHPFAANWPDLFSRRPLWFDWPHLMALWQKLSGPGCATGFSGFSLILTSWQPSSENLPGVLRKFPMKAESYWAWHPRSQWPRLRQDRAKPDRWLWLRFMSIRIACVLFPSPGEFFSCQLPDLPALPLVFTEQPQPAGYNGI